MPETAIRAEKVVRTFGRTVALDGVDLAVSAGEIYGFLGPNGAGKSTLTRVLCTLLTPSGGRAVVAGHDVVEAPEQVRLRAGVALQDAALDDGQTGLEMLRLQCRFYGLSRADAAQRVASLSELVDIGDALGDRVKTYSGGMKRRLDLALALVHDPEVLFLDEPTTGLDPVSRSAVWEEVRRLNREMGMTVFLTTQYLDEADRLADRVGIINHGRIVAEGTPDDLKRTIGSDVVVATVEGDPHPAVAALRDLAMGGTVSVTGAEITVAVSDGPRAVSPIAIALAEAAVPVRDLSLRRPTLDDVFLSVTGARITDAESGADGEPASATTKESM